MKNTKTTGDVAEDLAEKKLRRERYRILHRNLRFGRIGELDIVAEKAGVLVFVEVKAIVGSAEIGGLENITNAKIGKLTNLAQLYLQKYPDKHKGVRFDAIEVRFADSTLKQADIRHIEDAFRPV